MDEDKLTIIEEARMKVVRASELLNIIDGADNAIVALEARVDIITKMGPKTNDDQKLLMTAPNKIEDKKEVIKATIAILSETLSLKG